jgi:hypothetical protein
MEADLIPEVEKKFNLPQGLLQKIIELEKPHMHQAKRKGIMTSIKEIVTEAART